MMLLYFVLYLLAGVCFGTAAGRPSTRYDLVAAGLTLYVLVNVIQTGAKL